MFWKVSFVAVILLGSPFANAQTFQTDTGALCKYVSKPTVTAYGEKPQTKKIPYCQDASGRWRISYGAKPGKKPKGGNNNQETKVTHRGLLSSEWQPDLEAYSSNKMSLFTQIVQVDANEWAVYRFKPETVENVKVFSRGDNDLMISGDFKYQTLFGVSSGWAQVLIENGSFKCILFWDENNCRALKDTPSSQLFGEMKRAAERRRMDDPEYAAKVNCATGYQQACAVLKIIQQGVPARPWEKKYSSCMFNRKQECLKIAKYRCFAESGFSPDRFVDSYMYGSTQIACSKAQEFASSYPEKSTSEFAKCYTEKLIHPYCADSLLADLP